MKKVKVILDNGIDITQNYDNNFNICITGNTGVGKSNLGLWLYVWLCERFGLNAEELTHFTTDIDEFSKCIHYTSAGSFIVLDESGDKLNSDNYSKKFNRQFRATLSIIRKKRLLTIYILPFFKKLDPEIREEHIDFVFHLSKRGKVWLFDKELIDDFNSLKDQPRDISKGISSPESDDISSFRNKYPIVWKKYEDKIKKKVDSSTQELINSLEDGAESKLTFNATRKLLRVSPKTLKEYIETGLLHAERNIFSPKEQYLIGLDDIEKLKQKLTQNKSNTNNTIPLPISLSNGSTTDVLELPLVSSDIKRGV